MEKLTQDEIDMIYYYAHYWYSQRAIANTLGHTRKTIAKYLDPKKIIEHYSGNVHDYWIKSIDDKIKIIELEEHVELLKFASVLFITLSLILITILIWIAH